MSSSKLPKSQRITDTIADVFLLKVVNLAWPPKDRFLKHRSFADMLPTVGVSLPKWRKTDTGAYLLPSPLGEPYSSQVQFDPNALRLDWLETWRNKLREAWAEKTARVRRDRLRAIVQAYVALKVIRSQAVEPAQRASVGPIAKAVAAVGGNILEFDKATEDVLREPPADSVDTAQDPFLQVLYRALETAKRMCLCKNRECRHPFFVATKKTDKYCSPECAKPAKKAAKLKWWRKHGKAWRRAKRKKSQRKKGGKRP
jgi:hypothetical protein